jgi:glycosyltransferase involved in cell wall biosynthesis
VANAAVVVAPLRIARGIQNKVLEALAMAKPVIGSPAALDGLQVTDGVNVLRADSPSDWMQHLLALWANPTRGTEIGIAGREFVETHHTWDRCLRPFSRLLHISEEQPASGPAASPPQH